MRRPIQLQLLIPVLAVVVLAIAASSVLTAVLAARHAREQEEQSIQRVLTTLADANFPLTAPVLEKMAGLSGMEFVMLGSNEEVLNGTLPLSPTEVQQLAGLSTASQDAWATAAEHLVMGERSYQAMRVASHKTGSGVDGFLVVLYPEASWWAARSEVILPPLLVGATAAMVIGVVTTVLARRLVRPIKALGQHAAIIAHGHFCEISIPETNDELRDLAISINHMSERLTQYEGQVRQNERLRTLGQLGGGIAHQLRNSATGGRMALELHRRECPLEPACESLEIARYQFTLMETYLQRFLKLGQVQSAGDRVATDLGAMVEEVLPLVRPAMTHAQISWKWTAPAVPVVMDADADALRQLLVNLLLNAVEAASAVLDRPARIEIGLERVGESVLLTIADSGAGPPASVRDQLFTPFITGRPDGTGLGLAVSRQIVEEHGGEIAWQRVQEMTVFSVRFIQYQAEAVHGALAGS